MYSYSKVDCFKQCPFKFKLRYIDKLRTLPDIKADNALFLGVGLHKGIETTPEEGVAEYQKHFFMITDDVINWSMQLEYRAKQVKELLPEGGIHEAEIKTGDFIGYIDYLTDDIYDFKFTVPKNYPRYMDSKQLHLYKAYWEIQHPNERINSLKYVFIPKVNIRLKKTETIQQFRERLEKEMQCLPPTIVEVPYNESMVSAFRDDCNAVACANDYPKNETPLCAWCEYRDYCQSNGEIDWNIC